MTDPAGHVHAEKQGADQKDEDVAMGHPPVTLFSGHHKMNARDLA
jgi:hypothetical protein